MTNNLQYITIVVDFQRPKSDKVYSKFLIHYNYSLLKTARNRLIAQLLKDGCVII